jgi:hypothetical protein
VDKAQEALISGLLHAGLIQVGVFYEADVEKHIRLSLMMLPSYPYLLRSAAELLAQRLSPDLNRLICSPDAMALGTALSLITNLPLIWHTGISGAASRNFIGAYDIDHRAAFLTLTGTRQNTEDQRKLQIEAASVGLQIGQYLSLIDLDKQQKTDNISVIRLADAVRLGVDTGLIPLSLGQKALTEV